MLKLFFFSGYFTHIIYYYKYSHQFSMGKTAVSSSIQQSNHQQQQQQQQELCAQLQQLQHQQHQQEQLNRLHQVDQPYQSIQFAFVNKTTKG